MLARLDGFDELVDESLLRRGHPLFESLALQQTDERKLLLGLVQSRTPREIVLITRVVQAMTEEFDGIMEERTIVESSGDD